MLPKIVFEKKNGVRSTFYTDGARGENIGYVGDM
jgi:hypothetical protein